MSGDLCRLSAQELAGLVRGREVSPVAIVDRALERIREHDPAINACTVVLERAARAQALEAERAVLASARLGPLHGVPVAIKDAIWVKDEIATLGSRAFQDFRAPEDATIVRRLRDAGAIIVAKTTNPELLLGFYTRSELHGVTRNPWNLELTPGGSSGGSAAAVAAGMVPLSLGTDSGGSIRTPAAYTGLFGLKPSHGLVPRTPGFEEMRSMNAFGPLAPTLGDVRLCLEVISGPDPSDNLSFPSGRQGDVGEIDVRHLRIAWSPTVGGHSIEKSTAAALARSVETLVGAGLQLEQACLEGWNLDEFAFPIAFAELGAMLEGREHRLGKPAHELVGAAAGVSARTYYAAQIKRGEYTRAWESFFDRYDAFLSPTTAMPPLAADPHGPISIGGIPHDLDREWSYANLAMVASLTGCPALAVPTGIDTGGIPLSLQVMTRRFSDHLCLTIGDAISAVLPAAPLPA
jgi:Asp-tRNA(Asn)/Glu-tRNA(Gln) amidotransferase A subunit family amidase